MPADLVPGENSSWLADGHFLAVFSHDREGALLYLSLLIRAQALSD